MKKKVCRSCKMFYANEECPECHTNDPTTNWKGRIYIFNPDKSILAKRMGKTKIGEYAIKAR